MAFYNVWSRPFIQRSSPLGYLTVGMGAGAAALILFGTFTGRVAVVWTFGAPEWIAGIYLGVGGGALAFILWVLALRDDADPGGQHHDGQPHRGRPACRALVGEPITPNLIVGLVAVFAGIWIATTTAKPKA